MDTSIADSERPMNRHNQESLAKWQGLVASIGSIAKEGIGLQCPHCGEKQVRSIHGGIVEVSCGTRILIEKCPGETGNRITKDCYGNYPIGDFDCSVKSVERSKHES
jgi:hypothetical protein